MPDNATIPNAVVAPFAPNRENDAPKVRLHHLDGLRGLAALVVVFHHSLCAFDFALFTGAPANSRGHWDLWLASLPFGAALPGNLSVCIFFVLSGYVLTNSFSRTKLGIAALIAKRYVRLVLPILAVELLSWYWLASGAMKNQAVVSLTHSPWLGWNVNFSASFPYAVYEGFYGAFLFGSSSYDSVLWTMMIEFYGSMLLIVVCTCCKLPRWSDRTQRILCGIILLSVAFACHDTYLGLFGVGGAAYLFNMRAKAAFLCSKRWIVTALLLAGLFLGNIPYSGLRPAFITQLCGMAPLQYSIHLGPSGDMSQEAFWHAVGAIILLLTIDASPPLRSLFCRPIFQFLGRISFPLYLVHIPVMMSVGCFTYLTLLSDGVPVFVSTLISIAVIVATALAGAVILTRYVERYAISLSAAAANQVQAGWLAIRRKKVFFFEKKKQKTFDRCRGTVPSARQEK